MLNWYVLCAFRIFSKPRYSLIEYRTHPIRAARGTEAEDRIEYTRTTVSRRFSFLYVRLMTYSAVAEW